MYDERRTGLVQKEQLCVGIVINISNRGLTSQTLQNFSCNFYLCTDALLPSEKIGELGGNPH